PLKGLFDVLAGPLAQPSTPGVCYRRWRTVAFDGCGSLSVPDHERNRSWLGRTQRRYGPGAYPRLMLMTLCETGTRGLIGAVFGPATKGETDYAHDLVGHLTPDMLLLADRAFDSNELLKDIAAQGAQFLIRATSTRRPPVLALLPDGSYLTRIGGLPLRVIEADVRSRTADGDAFGGTYRLLTTLSDHRTDPADHLVRLYHERWEIEITYWPSAHPAQRPSSTFEGPGGSHSGDVGTAHPLPGPALGHGDRGGDVARPRSRPGRFHRRSGGSM
ncbi:transposase, partial [Streptomyces sp. NPDC102274]|uniref:transposase n=1 Tax=Streptomyces sp. NPDC102274 TaxID=3366151 RepID=UPI00380F4977